MKKLSNDFWVGILFSLISLFLYFLVIPLQVQGKIQRGLPPTFFPNLSVVWVCIFSLVLIIKAFFQKELHDAESQSIAERKADRKGALLMIFGCILYIIFCYLINYIISTIIILIVLMLLFKEKKWYLIISTALIITFGIYFLFGKVMSLTLPEGIFL